MGTTDIFAKHAINLGTFDELFYGGPPTAEELASDQKMESNALRTAAGIGGAGLALGALYRMLRDAKELSLEDTEPSEERVVRPVKVANKRYDSPTDVPWAWPAMIGAGGLGLYGGYHAVKAITDRVKAWRLEQELQEARKDFEDVLTERRQGKAAALIDHLTAGYEEYMAGTTKEAGGVNTAVGAYLTAAAALWAMSHAMTYNNFRKADPQELRKRVIKRRARLREVESPPPLQLTVAPGARVLPKPEAALAPDGKVKPDEDEDEEKSATQAWGQLDDLFGAMEPDDRVEADAHMVDTAKAVAKQPEALAPLAGIAKDPNVAAGLTEGIKEKTRSTLGDTFGNMLVGPAAQAGQ